MRSMVTELEAKALEYLYEHPSPISMVRLRDYLDSVNTGIAVAAIVELGKKGAVLIWDDLIRYVQITAQGKDLHRKIRDGCDVL